MTQNIIHKNKRHLGHQKHTIKKQLKHLGLRIEDTKT